MEHPITAEVEKVGIYYGYPVMGDGQIVVQQEGAILGMAKPLGRGKLFVWADEWIMFSSQWTGAKCEGCTVERFWINIFSYLMPGDECQVEPPETIR